MSLVSSSAKNIVIYAIYPNASATQTAPTRLIILNLNYQAAGTKSRPHDTVNVRNILKSPDANLKVLRLTATSADATSDVTFGGQSWENEGKVSGEKTYETVPSSGNVDIYSSEAVIVKLS